MGRPTRSATPGCPRASATTSPAAGAAPAYASCSCDDPGRRAEAAGVRVFAARAAGADSWLEAATPRQPRGACATSTSGALGAGRSPGLTPYDDPLIAVCTHGRHDACCAERGRPVALALAASRHADAVWECSHIGGDRFAGNLLVLPRGLYYGRVDPDSALELADAAVDGRVALDHLRGRSDLADAGAGGRDRHTPSARR